MFTKKTTVLLFFCLVSISSIIAQKSVADSLKKFLNEHTQADTTRINTLNALARELRSPKPATCDSLIAVSLTLADQLSYKKGKGYALAIKAVRLYDASKYDAAVRTFDEAKPLLESVHDTKDIIYLHRMYAALLMDKGDYAGSLDNFLQALKLAQQIDDIKQQINIDGNIGYLYNMIGDFPKAIPYQTEALKKAESIDFKSGMSSAYNAIGKTYKTKGDYPQSLDAYTKGFLIDQALNDSANIFVGHSNIGDVYERMGNYPEAFAHLRLALNYNKRFPLTSLTPWDEWAIGKAFTHSGNADSGFYYAKDAYRLSLKLGWRLYLKEITYLIAESAAQLKKWDTAYKYHVLYTAYKDTLNGQEIARKTTMLQAGFELDKKQDQIALLTKDKQLQLAENKREKAFLLATLGGLATLIVLAIIMFRGNKQKQRANILLRKQKEEIDKKAAELALQKDNLEQSHRNVELLGEIGRKITSSLSVEKIISTVYDNVNALMDASIFGIGIYHEDTKRIDFPSTYENGVALPVYSNSIYEENRFASLCFISGKEIIMGDLETEYKNFLQDVLVPKQGQQPVSLLYLPLKAKDKMMGVITVQSFNKNAYSEYHLYMLRTIAIYAAIALENAESYKKLNQTVESLTKTQTQLIHSEKMASLGELTAGIAHEIQNPLNFVTNFSEVNADLIDELQVEVENGNLAEIKELAKHIKENDQKINHHGKRADAIVKGMLQHSRTNSGQKEMTEINTMADEYLRLAYHGIRAKDKSFNAKFETEFDTNIGKINIVPQDIGRVLVNLINNAFYAVSQKKKMQTNGFEPLVKVSTKKSNETIEIKVKDNGDGISKKILDKIFQPFFTTKPTGQGTGLGLSLAYDIVTKGHGGTLRVETNEGEGSTFIIQLNEQG